VIPNARHAYLSADGQTQDPVARVLFLGDSFVDKSTGGGFHRAIVERLRPAGLEIINLAVSGTGPEHYLDVLKEFGGAVEPDLTVVFYFAGNDLINVIRHTPYRATGPLAGVRDRLRGFVHRIYLYHAGTAASSEVQFDFDAMLADGHDPELVDLARTGDVNPWLLLIPADARAHYLETNLELTSDESQRGIARLGEILAAMKQVTEGLGSDLALVVFPATTQISRSHFDFYERAGFDPDERTLTEAAPQEMIEGLAGRLGIPVLDLLPEFRAARDDDLYRPRDSHLNERGNRLAADRVAHFIVSENSGRAR
jgi:hypothetical protein